MAVAKPRITLKQIKEAANDKSFSRGEDYYSQGSIYNAMRQDLKIWANCSGSDEYETSVTLNKSGIDSSYCTCPYDWDGLCKHQVALLLTYLNDANQFTIIPPLAEFLKPKSREELVTLIEKMFAKAPALLSLLKTESAISNTAKGASIDLSIYQKQLKKAFRSQDADDMTSNLNEIAEIAEGFRLSGNWQDGGRLYQLLLDQSIEVYDDYVMEADYDGMVGCVIEEMASGLINCLGQAEAESEALRKSWLQTLLNATFKNIDLGGMDFASGAWEGLLDCGQDQDWGWIEASIRQKIQSNQGGECGRDALVELLAEQFSNNGDEEGSENIIEELGSSKQKIFLWAEQGKWDASIALAKTAFKTAPGLVFQLADLILAADSPERALKYVLDEEGVAEWKKNDWLENYYGRFGSVSEAIDCTLQGFIRSPNLPRYLKLKELNPKKQDWKPLQQQMFELLETKKNFELWIDILLSDGDLDRAIELLEELRPSTRFSKLLTVAKIAEKEKPKAAIEIYQTIVTDLIGNKNRSSYQNAVTYLKNVRSLYESTKQQTRWDIYILNLRSSYPTLRALQEELTKAKL